MIKFLKKYKLIIIIIIAILAVGGTLTGILISINNDNPRVFYIKLYADDALYNSFLTNEGEKITLPQTIEKEGYDFFGWYYDKDTWMDEFNPDTLINKDITLYAHLKEHRAEGKIEGRVMGGRFSQGETYQLFDMDSEVTIIADSFLEKEFSYWQLAGDQTRYTQNPYTFVASHDFYFTAVFQDLNKYNITVNGGYIDEDKETFEGYYYKNTTIKLTAVIPEGKKFVCWRIDGQEINTNPYNLTVTKELQIETLFVDFDIEEKPRGLQFSYDEQKQSYTVSDIVYSNEIIIDIPLKYDNGINGEHLVTGIAEKAFEYAGSLKRIIIPSTITEIQNQAFKGCSDLCVVYIPKTVINMGNSIFEDCSNLQVFCGASDPGFWSNNWNSQSASVVWGCEGYGETHDGLQYIQTSISPDKATIIGYKGTQNDIIVPEYCEEDIEITAISGGAFIEHENLSRIMLPSGISSIGSRALSECNRLLSMKINALFPPQITDTSLLHPDNAFALKIYVPMAQINSYKTNAIWSKYATQIYNLESVNEQSFAIEDGKLIQYMGYSSSPIIPASVTSFAPLAFLGCNITEVTVEENNQCFAAQEGVLYNKTFTELVYYPNNKEDIKFEAPEAVEKILTYAFFENHYLEEVDLPSVTYLEDYAFCNCNKIAKIYLRSEEPEFIGKNGLGSKVVFYVSSQAIEEYQNLMQEQDISQEQIAVIS